MSRFRFLPTFLHKLVAAGLFLSITGWGMGWWLFDTYGSADGNGFVVTNIPAWMPVQVALVLFMSACFYSLFGIAFSFALLLRAPVLIERFERGPK